MELHAYAQLEMIGFFIFVAWLFYYQSTSSRKASREAEEQQQHQADSRHD
ncbi:hypothetical protein [Rhabdochromatium marinum]|nr:hypothetical protein [Rhabdochromatium marinum]